MYIRGTTRREFGLNNASQPFIRIKRIEKRLKIRRERESDSIENKEREREIEKFMKMSFESERCIRDRKKEQRATI